MQKYRALTGLSIIRSRAEGTAPRKGPKKGMMFVTPTIVPMSAA